MEDIFGFIVIAAVFLLVFFISGMINEKNEFKRYRDKLLNEYGFENKRQYSREGYESLSGYYRQHKGKYTIDDITWNDLNMDDVYRQMNYCKTSAGDEYLYYRLRSPYVEGENFSFFERKVSFYQANAKERLELQLILHKMGYTGKYSIYDYLDNLHAIENRSCKKDIFGAVALLLAIVYAFINTGWGLALIFIVLLYNLVTYFKSKSEIDPYITSFRYIFRILHEIDDLKKCKHEVVKEEIEQLTLLSNKFDKFVRFSYLLMSPNRMNGDMMELGLDYIRMFFHLDIIKFHSMLEEVKKYRSEINEMLTLIGKLDMYLSVGEYRSYIGEYCLPEFKAFHYEAKALYHPLLKEPVKNDVAIKKSVLITGSNASGKSTFLKTVALNAILAQSIHTVCADCYKGDYFRVYSSITLKDNIFEGDSYYMTEIKSIKRILDAAKEKGAPVLAFVDEVLRGTNTIERIAASGVILQQLAQYNGFCFAATHDLELTEILNHDYENVHFEEVLQDGDISFPYRLQNGAATTRNAIALLKIMGYDNTITQKAQNQAQRFEINRKWEVLS